MYRQVLVRAEDANFQRIVWRIHPHLPIQHYKLFTLTFGTACAPYLAVKTLQKLAEVEKHNFPIASQTILTEYYVDALLTGCHTEEEAEVIYDQMNGAMNSGGFQLQKWSSNSKKLPAYIGDDKHHKEQLVPITADNMTKVLGIQWNRESDSFEYQVNLPDVSVPITKRQVLSDIARLHDPIDWIAPVVVVAKLIIQDIWKARLGWDDHLTEDLKQVWLKYRKQLVDIKNITIPIWIQYKPDCQVELHAFSNASRVAYAAAVFLRVIYTNKSMSVSLISAKTKVAPIEREISIPRLELCGAVLAAKLLSETSQVLNIPKENLYAWTDSTIVLAWLKGGASKWNTFVSDRKSETLPIIDYEQWGHVATEANPADCASIGSNPLEMNSHKLWRHGPDWLSLVEMNWQKSELEETQKEARIDRNVNY